MNPLKNMTAGWQLWIGQLPQPTGQQLLIWLGCAGAVLGGIAFLIMLVNQAVELRRTLRGDKEETRIGPQPLEVRAATEFVKRHECEARHNESVNAIRGLKECFEHLAAKREEDLIRASQSREKLYSKFEEAETAMIARSDAVRKELSDKIDEMPAQMIAILKNTGALRR